MSAVWRAWWGTESHWNLGTGRGWSGSRAPMGAGRPLSRWNTKELNSVSIPSQEETRRRRESAKKLLAPTAFARGYYAFRVPHTRGEPSRPTFLPLLKRWAPLPPGRTVVDQTSVGLDPAPTVFREPGAASCPPLHNGGGSVRVLGLVRRHSGTLELRGLRKCCSRAFLIQL